MSLVIVSSLVSLISFSSVWSHFFPHDASYLKVRQDNVPMHSKLALELVWTDEALIEDAVREVIEAGQLAVHFLTTKLVRTVAAAARKCKSGN